MTELRDVGFEIFLHLLRQITQAQTPHLVVPFNDCRGVFLSRIVTYPTVSLFVGGSIRHEVAEFHGIEPGELPEIGPETAGIEIVFSVDAENVSARLVEHPCRNNEASKRF